MPPLNEVVTAAPFQRRLPDAELSRLAENNDTFKLELRSPKKVRFAEEEYELMSTLSRKDISSEEKAAYYYTRRDLDKMYHEAKRLALANRGNRSTRKFRRNNSETLRGLECMTRAGMVLSRRAIDAAFSVVMMEQAQQRTRPIGSKSNLATQYSKVCEESKEAALSMARQDREEALLLVNETDQTQQQSNKKTRTSLRKTVSHRTKNLARSWKGTFSTRSLQ